MIEMSEGEKEKKRGKKKRKKKPCVSSQRQVPAHRRISALDTLPVIFRRHSLPPSGPGTKNALSLSPPSSTRPASLVQQPPVADKNIESVNWPLLSIAFLHLDQSVQIIFVIIIIQRLLRIRLRRHINHLRLDKSESAEFMTQTARFTLVP